MRALMSAPVNYAYQIGYRILFAGAVVVACAPVQPAKIPVVPTSTAAAAPTATAVIPLLSPTLLSATDVSEKQITHRLSAVSPFIIFSGPGYEYPATGTLEAGVTVGVIERKEGDYWPDTWFKIACPDGMTDPCWVLWDFNALYSYEGPPVDLEIPDPFSLKIESTNKTTSPDKRWQAVVTQTETVTLGPEEARFFYIELKIISLEDDTAWAPVSEWHAAGLGQEYAPQPFHWSQDGDFLYYTNPFDHHGPICVLSDNIGENFDRLDLTNGTVTVLPPPYARGMLVISPDETLMTYLSYRDGYRLIVRELATAYDDSRSNPKSVRWQIPLDMISPLNISRIAWSPDNRHVLVTETETTELSC